MPLINPNPKTNVFKTHDDFRKINDESYSPLKFFIEPVIVSLNYALKSTHYNKVGMVGLSGGGWTTLMTAAVDPRIAFSYSVAGSIPREFWRTKGDWEQELPAISSIINYYELYLIGALGKNRKSRHIYNLYDPCCFPGHLVAGFSNQMKNAARKYGIFNLEFLIDVKNRNHSISQISLDYIVNDLIYGEGAGLIMPSQIPAFNL